VDEAYMDNLFHETTMLYRLDQVKSTDGPLPETAVWLLVSLAAVWILLLAGAVAGKIRRKK